MSTPADEDTKPDLPMPPNSAQLLDRYFAAVELVNRWGTEDFSRDSSSWDVRKRRFELAFALGIDA